MTIRAVSVDEFARLCVVRPALALLASNGAEWFADEEDVVLGARWRTAPWIWLGRLSSWRKDHQQAFRMLSRETIYSGHDETRRRLLEQMAGALADDKKYCDRPTSSE
jgi:hypothetical protein